MLLFSFTSVVHGKAEELRFFPRFFHQRHETGFALDDLILDLRNRKLIAVLVRVGVITQIESASSPASEYLGSGYGTKLFHPFLDDKACDRGVMMPQGRQYLPIDLQGGGRI